MSKIKKVILAYSGGLDTSVIIHWLKEKYGCKVIAFAADVGQPKDFNLLRQRAVKSGADKVIIGKLKNEFAYDYILPTLQANATYEGKYLLSAALSRPLIAKKLVRIAKEESADAVSHGCTGKGNDQVRFEVTIASENPKLKIIAPLREWNLTSREEEIAYAKKNKIPIEIKKGSPYSIDKNLWGVSIECGILEDPWKAPPGDATSLVRVLAQPPRSTPFSSASYQAPCGISTTPGMILSVTLARIIISPLSLKARTISPSLMPLF